MREKEAGNRVYRWAFLPAKSPRSFVSIKPFEGDLLPFKSGSQKKEFRPAHRKKSRKKEARSEK